jgi:phosphoribosyl-ATP pyrophosphohydrolase
MLHARGVEWRDVVNELARRQGQSGIAEKMLRE